MIRYIRTFFLRCYFSGVIRYDSEQTTRDLWFLPYKAKPTNDLPVCLLYCSATFESTGGASGRHVVLQGQACPRQKKNIMEFSDIASNPEMRRAFRRMITLII